MGVGFVDARSLPDDTTVATDVCIVGAGPAGIALARELAGLRCRVCVLEGGGFGLDRRSQSLLAGEVAGQRHAPLTDGRVAGFGGTTLVWSGACRPLDRTDFEPRSWVPDSGWPFGSDELEPYYRRAHTLCELGPYEYGAEAWRKAGEPLATFPEEALHSIVFQFSPTRFGTRYRHEIGRAPNLTTFLHASATEVELAHDGSSVIGVRAAMLRGTRLRVRARVVVLAGGGIENARLLLASRGVLACGVGNQHDLVGRYFMEHLYLVAGRLDLANPGRFGLYRAHRRAATTIEGGLALSDGTARRERLLRGVFLFPPTFRALPEFDSPAVVSFQHLVRALRVGSLPYRVGHHAKQVAFGLDKVVLSAARALAERRQPRRWVATRFCGEQAPNRDSRVRLSDARDALGRPRARLEWRLSELDWTSIRRAHELLAAGASASGLGELSLVRSLDDVVACCHHLGTTRMHVEPCRGVVDPTCRVHGLPNLYVAGSSVFPTGGYANPTLTIVALALRLADHLKAEIASW
jgi:choline dehydrogenase-like flavoprotein